jgi:hypothetical protein
LLAVKQRLQACGHVNGKETERFALYLHKQVWQAPETSPPTALRNTQLFSLEKRGNEAAHPYYWAGWYVIGDIPTVIKKDVKNGTSKMMVAKQDKGRYSA